MKKVFIFFFRYQCEKSGVSIFAKFFDNTIDEILETINELRNINKDAMKNRYFLTAINCNYPSTSSIIININEGSQSKINFNNWVDVALIINKSRKILDETVVLLPKVLNAVEFEDNDEKNVKISDSKFVRANEFQGSINYNKLYQHLSTIVSARSINKITRLSDKKKKINKVFLVYMQLYY